MAPPGTLERGEIERVGQRLAKRDQPLQLRGAQPGLRRLSRGKRRLGLAALPLARLIENEHADEDRQRRQQVDVVPLLDVPRRVPHEAQWPLKHDDGAGNEANDERRVVPGDKAQIDPV